MPVIPTSLSLVRSILTEHGRQSRGILILTAGSVVLSSLTATAAPYLFSRLIEQLSTLPASQLLLAGFLLYAVLMGVTRGLDTMQQFLSIMMAENLTFIASIRFFDRLLAKTSDFFIGHNPAEIESASEGGINALYTIVQLVLVVFLPGLVGTALAVATLGFAVDGWIAGLVAAYGVILVAASLYANRRLRPALQKAIEAGQENARFVGNSLTAMETLRHFGAESWMASRFQEKAGEVLSSWLHFCRVQIAYGAALALALTLQLALTFGFLLPEFEAGRISIGDLVLVNAMLFRLNHPFEMIGQAIDDVVRAREKLKPLQAMWNAPEEAGSHRSMPLLPGACTLTFEHVGFAHPNGRGVQDVSFAARRGVITFLVGTTGAGKSTVLRLALKSITPQSGRIHVDGQDLEAVSRRSWYAHIGVVPQDIVLLNESLAVNIALGRPIEMERLRRAAEKAAILEMIEELPEGFETTVGERGMRLSGGERQRIAIARALYAEPQFLFLDEASSALDEATERDIMEHLRQVCDSVTILAVTHRQQIITATDVVVTIEPAEQKRTA